ncbi:hypothetical protein [Streptomyces sp. SAJ15]|uniref:hypothetical protein n=1 Tax=Streptomyces sp. SAJ15 TaxID=2011095 RepID=UPI001184B210|nr:hypothetical protein [Streptomyces sp. SAJ15]TVL88494.1 hypothetical protein CD790_31135 [Streptomyces sp. SAJ15]
MFRTTCGSGWLLPPAPERRRRHPGPKAPAEPVYQALSAVNIAPATARITAADLIVIHRDQRMYEWESYAHAPMR